MYDLILRDATLVSSAGRVVADVAIENGTIAYVGPRPPKKGAKEEISAIGKFLMPGVIDTAVQFDPNGDATIWERESRAAVTGGVTTVVGLPGGDRPVVDGATAEARAQRALGRSWCNFALWGLAKPGNAKAMMAATKDGWVVGTLACLASDDQPHSLEAQSLADYVGCSGVLGVQIGAGGAPDHDALVVAAVLEAVRRHERAVHLVHLSTAEELQILDPVRGDIAVTAGVTPHHLFLSNDTAETAANPRIHTRPPVRPEHDRRTLWSAVKRGRLDCVASDHHPSLFDSNHTDGVPGTELLFPLMLSAVKYGRLSLELLVSLCSEAPARIFDLPNKGRIEKGADADLILFSEGEVSRVSEQELLSGAGWSPYVHREAAPKPEMVMIAGHVVARRGKVVADKPTGRWLRPSKR